MNAEDLVLENIEWAEYHARCLRKDLGLSMEVEDVQQEALVALVEASRTWSGKGPFQAYAYAAIKNRIIELWQNVSLDCQSERDTYIEGEIPWGCYEGTIEREALIPGKKYGPKDGPCGWDYRCALLEPCSDCRFEK